MAEILPAIFFGHGNPMNAVLENGYTNAWSRIGRTIPKPKAILSISAHWFVSETGVTIATSPKTIHDSAGFRENYFKCNILRLVIPISPVECKNCSHRWK